MNRLYKSCLSACAGLLIGTLAMGQGRPAAPAAPAAAPANTPAPNRLAVVNLAQLIYSLDEWNDFKTEATKMQAGFADEAKNREKALKDMQTELDNPTLFKKDSAEYKKMEDDYVMKSMDYQTFTQFVPQKLLLEVRLETSRIYKRANDAIAAYAQANGIALVYLAEDVDSFASARSQQELSSMVMSRKVLYANPDFDITKKLIEKMNADYGAGRKTP